MMCLNWAFSGVGGKAVDLLLTMAATEGRSSATDSTGPPADVQISCSSSGGLQVPRSRSDTSSVWRDTRAEARYPGAGRPEDRLRSRPQLDNNKGQKQQ